jgi:hypothetical protein
MISEMIDLTLQSADGHQFTTEQMAVIKTKIKSHHAEKGTVS